MIIIHKDVLDTIKSDYIKRIKDGKVSTTEILEMYESLTQMNNDRMQTIDNLEKGMFEIKEKFEAITDQHEAVTRESAHMRQYLTDNNLLSGYFEYKIAKACNSAKTLDWKGE